MFNRKKLDGVSFVREIVTKNRAWECYEPWVDVTSTIYHQFIACLFPKCSPKFPKMFPKIILRNLGDYSHSPNNFEELGELFPFPNIFGELGSMFPKFWGICQPGLGGRIQNKSPMAVSMRCLCHSVSVPVKNLFSAVDFLSKVQELTFEILKLIKFSPTEENVLEEIKNNVPIYLMWENSVEAEKVAQCNPERWTQNKRPFMVIINDYDYLRATFINQSRPSETSDSFMRSRCSSVAKHLSTFDYHYELSLGPY